MSPSIVDTESMLTATASSSDPEGDALTYYTFKWTVDDGSAAQVVQTTAGSSASDSLDGLLYFDKDDSVTVLLTVDEGTETASSSASATVVNTLPIVYNAMVTPSDPLAGADDLLCSGQSGDADSDPVTLSYAWDVDGAPSCAAGDTVPASETSDGETWTCTLTPDDGFDEGASVSASVVVGADSAEAVGGGICAAPGSIASNSYQMNTCLSPASPMLGEHDSASYILQQGPLYRFNPGSP
jgi:hypothetical protein